MDIEDEKENRPKDLKVKVQSHETEEQTLINARKRLQSVSNRPAFGTVRLTISKVEHKEDDNLDSIQSIKFRELLFLKLSDIELQTKQTGLDLGQLFEKLKNNNQYLNKLLESLSNYSREVITDGNATKADVMKLLKLLEVLKVDFDRIETKQDESVASIERLNEALSARPNSMDTSSNDKRLEMISNTNNLCQLLPQMKVQNDEIYSSSKTVIDKLELFDIKNGLETYRNAVEDVMSKGTEGIVSPLYSTLNSLKEDVRKLQATIQLASFAQPIDEGSLFSSESSDTVLALNDIKDDLKKLQIETTEQNNDILMELASATMQNNDRKHSDPSLSKLEASLNATQNNLTGLLLNFESQASKLSTVFDTLSKKKEADHLETKVINLEQKYQKLCDAYEAKYEELKKMRYEFVELSKASKEAFCAENQAGEASIDCSKRLFNVRKFHESNLNLIQVDRQANNIKEKRVVSTPLNK